jgi:hypothetical protein
MRTPLVSLAIAACAATAFADRVADPPEPALLPPKPRVPPPPGAVKLLGSQIAGTLHCKGVYLHLDGSSTPLVATMTTKLDLDGAWIQTSLVAETKPEPDLAPLRYVDYRTFDPIAKQWTRVSLDNTGGRVTETSFGVRGGEWTWNGTTVTPVATYDSRDHEQRDGGTLKIWGEAMLGGSWQKVYEATCKK